MRITMNNENYYASQDASSFNVFKANSSIIINNIVDGIYNTSDVVVSLSVVNKTSVSYIVKNKDTVVVRGDVVSNIFNISNLTVGNYTLAVFNAENENYFNSSYEHNFTVNKAQSDVSIINITNGIYNTQDSTFDVVVNNKTGVTYLIVNGENVNFTVDMKNIESTIIDGNVKYSYSNGIFKFNITGLNAGNYNISVYNTEDENYYGSLDKNSFAVIKAKSNSSVIINNITNPNHVGDNVIVNYTVLNKTTVDVVIKNIGTGEVIRSGYIVDSDSIVISNLESGEYTINITNAETDYISGSYNESVFIVNKAHSNVSIYNVNDGVYNTRDVVLNVVVNNQTNNTYLVISNGEYNFTMNLMAIENVPIGANIKYIYRNGVYNVNISGLNAGSYKISVYESFCVPGSDPGDERYIKVPGVLKTSTLKVKKAKTIVKAPKVKYRYKRTRYFKVTVKHKTTKKAMSGIKLKLKVYTRKKYKTYTIKTNKQPKAVLRKYCFFYYMSLIQSENDRKMPKCLPK